MQIEKIEYYIVFKHIPIDMMFTPTHLISNDHIKVNAKKNANEWDLQNEVCNELKILNYMPEHIRIISYQIITKK